MGLSLPGCGCIRQDHRLPAQPAAQRRLGKSLFSQGRTFSGSVAGNHHTGRLCSLAQGRSRTSTARKASRADEASLVKIPKQSNRAGSSQCEVQAERHARPEKLRFGCHDNSRRRAHTSHSQRPVRLTRSGNSGANSVRNLGSCLGCMNPFGEYAALRRFTRNLHQSPLKSAIQISKT